MSSVNKQTIIEMLTQLANCSQLDEEQVDKAIDALEDMKSTLNVEDDESIDKIDEMQDYLEYVLSGEESSLEDVQEQLFIMIDMLYKMVK